jgi:hypothetical protein
MRLILSLVSFTALALSTGCKAGNACGDAEVVCRDQCNGGPEQNICFNDRVCTDGEWICFCRACTFDLATKDTAIPQDFSSPSDLVSSD